MAEDRLTGLEGLLRGELITRDDQQAFEAARFRGWNHDLNARANPLGFAIVSGARDIATTVRFCRSNGIPITVRGKGTHSPYGMANDALVIDLVKMTAVRVDPENKLAYIQAGADIGDVDHETALYDLVCVTGAISHTGFAGVALGGGVGHLSRWLGAVVDSIVAYQMVNAQGDVVWVDEARDPELFWGMRGNGASFGIVTEFVLKLRDMPNDGIIRGGQIIWGADRAKEVMTAWMDRITRPNRKRTETLEFVFLLTPDGQSACAVAPIIVGESEQAARAACDEVAAYGGGAMLRRDAQIPYTVEQTVLDRAFPHNANYWDKGVFIDWDPKDPRAVQNIVDTAIAHWNARPGFATKASTFLLFMEVGGAVADADPASTSFAARGGRLWCTTLTGWPEDDDAQRAGCKKWCDDVVGAMRPFQVTTYLNNAMPTSQQEMLAVFPEQTMKRLNALKKKHDPENLFKTGAWQYEANL